MAPSGPRLTTGRDIHNLFRSSRQDVPIDSLKALRDQISLKFGEASLSLQDARLIVVKEWLELSSGAEDIFALLEKRQQPTIEAVCLSILASLLTLTTQYFVFQSLGHPIVKNLLTPRWLRKLNSHLSGGHLELCFASLRLLNAVSNFAGGKEQKYLLETFPWDRKTFQKLLHMRRRDKAAGQNVLAKPDIRTLCLQFICSFLSSSSHIKAMFLEQYREIFLSIFKGLDNDAYPVVHYILEILWTNIWQDQRLRKTLKVTLFGEKTMQHLLKLYDCSPQEDASSKNVPADVVHHFLLAICTHRGVGICFVDNGWYPRQDDERETSARGERIHNKILANVLKMLKVSDDARQQELALKILHACPELVAGYLPFLVPTLEPRLSTKWLASMAFYGAIVSLPVPAESFHLPTRLSKTQSTYRPVPPSLSVVVNNIFPSAILKTHLTKALQSSHALLQHTAGLLLAQCLGKYESVQDSFRVVKSALEEDEVEGQWARRLIEIDREIRKRVPEINVVIAFSTAQETISEPTVRSAMLAELSQRILLLYHRCMSSLIAEVRYDVAKSLRTIACFDDNSIPDVEEIWGWKRLQQLHVLCMLMESDQFIWHAKTVPSGPSNLYILLDISLKTNHVPVREAVSTLLVQALRDSLLFQHDPEELHIWLDALPTTVRNADAYTFDGVRLSDERQCTMSFLEACMLRCFKTPHRYLEELDSLTTSSSDSSSSSSISPVLVTVLQQLHARIRSKTLEPSDVLSLTTFTRKVIVGLAGKQPHVRVLRDITRNLRMTVTGGGAFAEFPSIAAALRGECNILDNCLAWCSLMLQSTSQTTDTNAPSAELDLIARAGQLENEGESAVFLAYELVDRIRLLDHPLSPAVVNRVACVIKRLYAPTLSSFCLHLAPGSGSLWALADEDISSRVPLDWILLHLDLDSQPDARFTSILRTALRKGKGRHTSYQYRSLLGLMIHRLHDQRCQDTTVHVLEVLNVLLESAKHELPAQQFTALKNFVLFERQSLRLLACAQDLPRYIIPALDQLLGTMLDASSDSDRLLVSPICDHWVMVTSNSLECASWNYLSGSCIWIKFMPQDGLFAITDQLLQALRIRDVEHDTVAKAELPVFAEALLARLSKCGGNSHFTRWLKKRIASFLSLRKILPESVDLDKVLLYSVDMGLLFGCGGVQPETDDTMLRKLVGDAEVFWESRLLVPPENASVAPLLCGTDWSLYQSNAVASFIYRCPAARHSFWLWLSSGTLDARPTLNRLAPAIVAVLNTADANEPLEGDTQPFVMTLFLALTSKLCSDTAEETLYGYCLVQMIKHFPTLKSKFLEELTRSIALLPLSRLHSAALYLVQPLLDICPESALLTVDAIIVHSLQWAVRHLSEIEGSTDLNEHYLNAITSAVWFSRSIASHYAEPVIAAAIRHHLGHTYSMHLVEALLKKTTLKPVTVNRHLQSILQHREFLRLASSDPSCTEKEATASVLYALFFAYPNNACQPSHVQSLVQLYSGSLAASDRQVLAIFSLFEEQRRMPVASVFTQWPHSKATVQGTLLDSVSSLDANRILRTCLSFPDRRSLNVRGEVVESRPEDSQIYDPIFILLLFSSMLAECPPRFALSWVSLYRTSVVSLIIRCLSSIDNNVRKVALLQLGTLYRLMKTADMQEKEHVVYLLDLICDLVRRPSDQANEIPPRLPSLTTLFFAHALRGIFYPSNFIYPISARFLLQRPRMDHGDVPLLYSMLYSSTDNWRKERGWIVRFLADSILNGDDWSIVKRRHTWDLLASMFQGSYVDGTLRHSILEVLANLTCHTHATNALVHRSSLIHWIEMQLSTIKHDECIAWAKILENISVVADQNQLGQVTNSELQNGLVRCLMRLTPDSDISLLRLISRVLLRLNNARLYGDALRNTMELGLERLRAFENSHDVPMSVCTPCTKNTTRQSLPPHTNVGLHQPVFENNLETWGRAVENMWSVSLRNGADGSAWDQLTSRLLLWRALVGEVKSPLGEWARTQALIETRQRGTTWENIS
ncbi:hypothetical protein ACEPAG_3520 [Sanghuangporus baumii]